jgi:hypothetical protein
MSAPITVRLLTSPLRLKLQPPWYGLHHGCVVCRGEGTDDADPGGESVWLPCERCGAGFHDSCYFAEIATRWECEWWARWSALARRVLGVEEDEVETPPEVADEEDDEGPIFLCKGCRS